MCGFVSDMRKSQQASSPFINSPSRQQTVVSADQQPVAILLAQQDAAPQNQQDAAPQVQQVIFRSLSCG
jgi:hypothetical protein